MSFLDLCTMTCIQVAHPALGVTHRTMDFRPGEERAYRAGSYHYTRTEHARFTR